MSGLLDGARLRRQAVLGFALVFGLGGSIAAWAATTRLAGAVIAAGSVVTESYVKKVQHPVGGTVAVLNVRSGDRVEAGEVLMSLDPAAARASLGVIERRLDAALSRLVRLEAERDGLAAFPAAEAASRRLSTPEAERLLAGERRLFELRRKAREGDQSQRRERIAQLETEIRGLALQEEAKVREIELASRELAAVRSLWDQKLTSLQRVTALERDVVRLEGERGRLVESQAKARGQIAETELQILQIERDFLAEVAKEIREVESSIDEDTERRAAAAHELAAVDIRAPQGGVVHELTVHAPGAVVTAGEAILTIVPEADRLIVEARVAPGDIDQVQAGQAVLLRLTGLHQRTTPELAADVASVSPDLVTDTAKNTSYYRVRIVLREGETARLGGQALVPGMPAEAHIRTSERTALAYLVKPLTDQIARAFRDD